MRVKKIIKSFLPSSVLSFYHLSLAWLGAFLYGFPSRKMIIIGVTGTSGKSTTVELITQIFQKAGFKVASLSSIGFRLGKKSWRNDLKMTMPGRFYLQRFLARAWRAQCQYVVLEVTSEGILQSRHRFIDFDVLVFTNLSPEHLERHGGFENYKKTKGKLFQILSRTRRRKAHRKIQKTIIVNLDDPYASYFSSFPADRRIGYSLKPSSQLKEELFPKSLAFEKESAHFIIQGTKFHLFLPGRFNVSNALAAIAVGYSQGLKFSLMSKALAQVKQVPGRLEKVISYPFQVFVDYAHTPVALEKVYQTLRPSQGKMICLLGSCGGGRDKWKRPVLGKIASRYCQKILVTNEDPYDENPEKIIQAVAAGVEKSFPRNNLLTILDRRKAIQKALSLAQEGDVVVLTGKGSESLMCLADGKKIPWSDKGEVLKAMKKITALSPYKYRPENNQGGGNIPGHRPR